jgi:hypothetical protein
MHELEPYCEPGGFEPRVELPPKGKGVPKIKRELLDTYIVTTGKSYNLQVWNRIPNSSNQLITYEDGSSLNCDDVRYALIKVDEVSNEIKCIVIMTAPEIERRFGKFGMPTIKWQLIISQSDRDRITHSSTRILLGEDLIPHEYLCNNNTEKMESYDEPPRPGKIMSLRAIAQVLSRGLIGKVIDSAATKNRGQSLEAATINLLGYHVDPDERLQGGYPDLPNQALEIKIQDSPTVDLGKYSPQTAEVIFPNVNVTTQSMRYLIALTDASSNMIEGIVVCAGADLGNYFSYVADKSYKCQRSIPMEFFDQFAGESVFLG